MKALILTSGGPMGARIVHAWLAGGNSVSALWIGQKFQRRIFQDDRLLGLAAPSWSVTALARRHGIPIETHCAGTAGATSLRVAIRCSLSPMTSPGYAVSLDW